MTPVNVAVADLGSNTLKFSVTRVDADGSQHIVHASGETVRLGHGIGATGQIEPARIDLALAALRSYESLARALGTTVFIGVATAAVRMATNGSEFLARIASETSWRVRVISGDEEAHLAFLGLQTELPAAGTQVIADIGGASTELIHVVDGAVQMSQSIQIGSGTLADRCLATDPPGPAAVRTASSVATGIFASQAPQAAPGTALYLSGGNGVFLSQVAAWDAVRLPFVVPFFPLLVDRLANIPAEQVAAYLNIAPVRARMLPAGAAIALSLIERLMPVDLYAVQSGIRGGLVRQWLADRGSDSAISGAL